MSSAEPPLLAGRYRVGDCIGEGGMARVYRAEDTALGRTVALKRMRGSLDDDQPRVRSEMRVLAGLSHPSLVTLLDAHLGDETPGGDGDFLVMEYVEGPTLAQCLSGGPLPAATAAALTMDLADALHTVHAAGIVHRDIKPSNILLSPSPLPMRQFRAKLADFGIAYLHDSARITSPGLVLGTAAYLAPEQVRGDAPTPAVDVFSLGLVTIEALTGLRAYRRGTGAEALVARLAAAPDIPPDLDDGWRELLVAMTALDPQDRPTALEVAVAASALTSTGVMIAMPPAAAAPIPAPSGDVAREQRARVQDLDTSELPVTMPTVLPVPSTSADPLPVAVHPGSSRRAARTDRTRRSRRATALWGAAAVATLLVAGVVSALSGAFGTAGSVAPVVSEPTPARILPAPDPTEESAEENVTSPATVLDSVPASDTDVRTDDAQPTDPQPQPAPTASARPAETAPTPRPSVSPVAPGGDGGGSGAGSPSPTPSAPSPTPTETPPDDGDAPGAGSGNGPGSGIPEWLTPPPFDRESATRS